MKMDIYNNVKLLNQSTKKHSGQGELFTVGHKNRDD